MKKTRFVAGLVVVHPTWFEHVTSWSAIKRSIQLSYGCILKASTITVAIKCGKNSFNDSKISSKQLQISNWSRRSNWMTANAVVNLGEAIFQADCFAPPVQLPSLDTFSTLGGYLHGTFSRTDVHTLWPMQQANVLMEINWPSISRWGGNPIAGRGPAHRPGPLGRTVIETLPVSPMHPDRKLQSYACQWAW